MAAWVAGRPDRGVVDGGPGPGTEQVMGAGADRLGWYARRLTSMSPAEVAWRAGRAGRSAVDPLAERLAPTRGLPTDDATWRSWWTSFRDAEGRPVLLDPAAAERAAAERPEQVARVVEAAERLLEGRVRYFGYPETRLGRPVDWHRDGVTGRSWPRDPAARIDHRTAPGDPKWIWELNRLQHLPWLAQAWIFTGREDFAALALEHLDTWVAQNPVGVGIAWRGGFEAGVRSISVLVALQGLRDSSLLTPERFRSYVEVLEASGRLCWRERSLFSSANNHLVGELAGLATIGLLLPELPRSGRWVRRALAGLAEQADRQVLPDGSGAEQSLTYQLFTVEFLLLVLALTPLDPLHPGSDRRRLEAAVARSSRYLGRLVEGDEPVPRYGDDDQGFVLRLDPEEVRTVADHLDLVRSWATGVGGPTLGGAWFAAAPGAGVTPPLDLGGQQPGSTYAPHGGLVVLRSPGRRVTMDVGPLGHLAIAAHGHADALAVSLVVDGRRVVDEPGTGSYYGHPDWRTAHRSTSAHATVTVDGQDQSVMGGPFLWTRHAQVRVHEVDLARGVVDAEHDGYERLDQPVRHRRRLEAPPADDGLVVVDVLTGEGRHDVALGWPLAPDLTASPRSDGHLVLSGDRPVVQLATAGTVALVHDQVVADEATALGWWSDRLESRRPAPLLQTTGRGEVPMVLVTVVRRVASDGEPPVRGLEVTVEGDVARVRWQEGPDLHVRSLALGLPSPVTTH